jgi:hypothetical protein
MWISKMYLHSIHRMAITIISLKSLSTEATLKDRYLPVEVRAILFNTNKDNPTIQKAN